MKAVDHSFDLAVIGGGMGAARLLQLLHGQGFERSIGWIGAEPEFGYNRVLLPDYLSQHCSLQDLESVDPATLGLNVEPFTRVAAASIDLSSRTIALADGRSIGFKLLVLATGGTVPRPPVPGCDLGGVLALRSLADAAELQDRARNGNHAIVIGGGLLGLEAGKALLALGLTVRVVHRQSYLLNRQLDEPAARLLQSMLEAQGFTISCGTELESINGYGECESVDLSSGERLPADLVILATGVIPNDTLAAAAGLTCRQGVIANASMETDRAGVYAMGECARIDGQHHSLVEPVFAQAQALAATLCGNDAPFSAPPQSTRLKVSGIQLFSSGDVPGLPAQQCSNIVISDAHSGLYRRLAFSGTQLKAAILLGNVAGARNIQTALNTQIDSRAQRQQLAFGF